MRNVMRGLLIVCALSALAVFAAVVGRTPPARAAEGAAPAGTPRRVKVLWLGDKGHHTPVLRARQVYTPLGRHGVDLTYTEDMADLNPQTLGRYDVLLVYANIDKIAHDQEKAVLDYVEAGHGFAPIHCGSYCFLNSPKLTALAGGRFKSHGTGVFKETIVQPDHPIEKGLKPIESWDESYVHEMHNEKDRTVLGYRGEGEKKEPYTWVRTQGKGRVFYTAWGHDERTWGNADFLALLERGVRWAAGDWALEEQPRLKPFEFTQADAAHALPNYIPGPKWGETGDLITRIQNPVDPAESMTHMTVPPGFEVKLFAGDPDIKKPICMAFDERGRLWVAETFDYPNEMQEPGKGRDRITICEDTDGDGKADKFTVFADKLSIPTSMVFANGGVIVAQAPDMLFFKDADGDGKADKPGERTTLFSGWGTKDTHAGPSNLRWGLDGWVYGTVGYSGFRGEVGGQRVSFGQGLFRFKPDGDKVSKLEFLGSTNNNTWGLGITEDFEVFASTANHNPAFYLNIPNRYFETVRGWSPRRPATIADDWHFWPVTGNVRQVDQHGGYTAGAGAAFYTARSFPQHYWNRVNFVAEPTGHLLGQFEIVPTGTGGFLSENRFNLLTSDDEWTAPIAGEVGPDGAVWMIDWYNIVVQHNPIPRGFVAGKGGAYESPLRDKRHGRVYKIAFTGGKPSPTMDLSKASPEQLVDALRGENMLWRAHAQRLLVERGNKDKSVLEALAKLAGDRTVDGIGLNPAAIHALWAMADLGALDGSNADATAVAVQALGHPSAGVRKTALAVLPRTAESAAAILKGNLLTDREPLVRKEALLALSEMPSSEQAAQGIFTALTAAAEADGKRPARAVTRDGPGPDTTLADAAVIAAAHNDAAFLRAVVASHSVRAADAPAGGSEEAARNLMPNPGFENERNGLPIGWQPATYGGSPAKFEWAAVGHGGSGHSVMIRSDGGSDVGWKADVPCQPNTSYRLSAWIKTEGVTKASGAQGALLNIHNLQAVKTNAVSGTGDWKRVEATFNSEGERSLTINCLFGGWGRAKGTAWFDDVELVKAGPSSLPGAVGQAVSVVTNHYAQRAPVESIVATLSAMKAADPALATAVVDGLAAGWPANSPPNLSDADAAELQAVMKALPPRGRDRLLSLAERWGRRELFGEAFAAATKELEAAVVDGNADAGKRADAAKRLVAVADTAQTVDLILKQVNPQATPDVQLGLLGALGESKAPAVGEAIVGRYGTLTPSAQKAGLALLLKRQSWTAALLAGVKGGKINEKDLAPSDWQALTTYPDADIAKLAKDLQKSTGRAPTADRKAVVDKFLPLAQNAGDAAKGRLVFEKNCMVCHTIEGKGGPVGPDLTGVGARPKGDILVDVLDPNRSVEGTFRQWNAKTADDVISGRLMTESRTSVEIVDAAGTKHDIQRSELKALTASDRSVMPEGFEQLPPEDLTNLLEFLATSKVKH